MADKSKKKIFLTMEEYRSYYQTDTEKKKISGSKYYRLGAEIARQANERAMHSSSRQSGASQSIA